MPALEVEALGELITAPQGDDVAAEGAQLLPAGRRIGLVSELDGGKGVMGGDEEGQVVGDGALAGLGKLAGFGHETAGFGEGGLLEEPVGVVAFFPLGEVGRGEGMACKLGGEQMLDFGHGVERRDDLAGGLAVAQTGVDILADMMGKAGDFTDGGVAHRFDWVKMGDNWLKLVIGEERDEGDGHGRTWTQGRDRIGGGFHIIWAKMRLGLA